jgi:hypothetical protein
MRDLNEDSSLELYPDDPWGCEGCDFYMNDGATVDITGVDDVEGAVKDCGMSYLEYNQEAYTIVFKNMAKKWMAVRATEEEAKLLHVFPTVDGELSAELRDPNQTELELGL